MRCRTASLGGHRDPCSGCGHTAISYNSCRNRHCPRCQGNARLRLIFTCCHPSLAAGSARGAHQHSIMLHLWGQKSEYILRAFECVEPYVANSASRDVVPRRSYEREYRVYVVSGNALHFERTGAAPMIQMRAIRLVVFTAGVLFILSDLGVWLHNRWQSWRCASTFPLTRRHLWIQPC
jgi:hypothetical protein